MKLLRIDSSARRSSVSRDLTASFERAWINEHPDGQVVERDLSITPLPHITDDWSATYGDQSALTSSQLAYLSTSDVLIDELMQADVIVIGAPMYNFMISWELKAWIDQVVRVGKTVRYGAAGSQGLLAGKKAVVITSRGGSYSKEAAGSQFDFQEAYLRRVLSFLGMADVVFIHAQNQARIEDGQESRAAALSRINEIVKTTATKLAA